MDNSTTVNNTAQTTDASDVDAHLKHEPPLRKKTYGEHVFNWRTYGGIALLGNEAASLVITETVARNTTAAGLYEKYLLAPFTSLAKFTKPNSNPNWREYFVGNPDRLIENKLGKLEALKPRLPYLLLATIGGMIMVPFVKHAEDHKGEQVRKLDRKHYGALTDSDPKLIEAHKEMDEAPKQSWGSLLKGRFTTIGAAIVADYTFGWDHALTTKFGKEISLNGLARKVASFVPENYKKYKPVAENGTWLLALSSTLTILFYASSKLFAKKNEEKVERQQELLVTRANGTHADGTEDALEAVSAEHAETKLVTEKPSPQVKNISREQTVASTPELSQGT